MGAREALRCAQGIPRVPGALRPPVDASAALRATQKCAGSVGEPELVEPPPYPPPLRGGGENPCETLRPDLPSARVTLRAQGDRREAAVSWVLETADANASSLAKRGTLLARDYSVLARAADLVDLDIWLLDAGRPLRKTRRPLFDSWRRLLDVRRQLFDSWRPSLNALRRLLDSRRRSLDVRRPLLDSWRRLLDAWRPSLEARGRVLTAHFELLAGLDEALSAR
jgi:hypothetical protein